MTKARSLADFIEADGSATIDGLTVGQGAGNVASNTAVGKDALDANTTGVENVAVGQDALGVNTTGEGNTAMGFHALDAVTTGNYNTAVGRECLSNSTGSYNTSVGVNALRYTTTANYNTAVGHQAAYSNTTGAYNTALGNDALKANTTASANTAVGYQALYANTTGVENVSFGAGAGTSLTTGSDNVFVGMNSGYSATGSYNTCVGQNAYGTAGTTGSKNTIIGRYNGNQGGIDIRTSSNNIVLSNGDGHPALFYNGNGYGTFEVRSGNIAGGNWGQILRHTAASNNYGLYVLYSASPNSTGSEFFYAADSTESKFYVSSNGSVGSRTNSYGGISDIKLKENITEASSQWADIKAIQVKKYSFITENSVVPTQLGVIAQDLESAGMSGLVFESQDKDSEGHLTGTTTKTVKYSVLYMKAVKALQEAMERIETLEAKVAALETP